LSIDDVNITPSGTGQTLLNNSVLVSGNLHATGNVTFDGNIVLGNNPSDTIFIAAEVNSDIIPSATATYNLGSNSLQWKTAYANNFIGGFGGTLTSTSAVNLSTMKGGNVYFTNNNISAYNGTSDFTVAYTGTGKINFSNAGITIKSNSITTAPGTPLTINATGTGYTKFVGTNGVVISIGSTAQRSVSPETGTLRYNTDNGYVEVYDPATPTKWIGVNGTSPTLSLQGVYDTAEAWALIFA
jgi:hypothetical protein